MLSWGAAAAKASTVGLEFQRDGLAVVVAETRKDLTMILAADFLTLVKGVDPGVALKAWLVEKKMGKMTCNIVLSADAYQILLVEPPDVPEAELRSAIRWRLKDLITISPEKAAIDVFPLPEDGTRAKKKMVYVVVTEADRIRSLINSVKLSGLQLNAIDIGELAIRNVATRLLCDDNSERGIAVARLRQGAGSVYIYRHGNMYLARNFALDYNAGLLDDLPQEALALELQRSVDYYERQMGQAPPTVIYLCGDHVSEDKIGPTLKASLAIQLQLLDPSAAAMAENEIDPDVMQRCLAALGVALRQERTR